MLPVRRNQWDNKCCNLRKSLSKLPFISRRGHGRTRDKSEVNGLKFKKKFFF